MLRLIIIFLGIWSFISGIFAVTNIKVVWSEPVAGFAALLCGLACAGYIFTSQKSG